MALFYSSSTEPAPAPASAHERLSRERTRVRQHYRDLDLTPFVTLAQPSFPKGGGTFSDVYLGTLSGSDDAPPVRVALKVLRQATLPLESEEKIRIFKELVEEVSLWRRLQHDHIHRLRGLWWFDDFTFPAMISNWEGGGNLVHYLSNLPSSQEIDRYDINLNLLEGVLKGLGYLHGQKVVHADIKGENVLVSSTGKALLCDFGLSWTSVMYSVAFSVPQGARGTIGFMAPEMFGHQGLQLARCTQASDIWAFGCLVYQVFTCEAPWHKKSQHYITTAHANRELFGRPTSMTRPCWDLLRSCCTFDVVDRPDTDTILLNLTNLRRSTHLSHVSHDAPHLDRARSDLNEQRKAARVHYADINLLSVVTLKQPAFPIQGGGYADIYRGVRSATNTSHAIIVSLKILRSTITTTTPLAELQTLKQLRQEISVWRRLEHPNIHALLGLYWPEDWVLPAMVSRWEDHGNLMEYLRSQTKVTSEGDIFKLKIFMLAGVSTALEYLHSESIIHANIKGANVLVSEQGQPLLCDFGLSWTSSVRSVTFSTDRLLSGNVKFMAPEQFQDESRGDSENSGLPYSYASDVWSFGCLVYEVFTGAAPWGDIDIHHVPEALSRQKLFLRPSNLDVSVWKLVTLCCVFDAARRPAMAAVVSELRDCAGAIDVPPPVLPALEAEYKSNAYQVRMRAKYDEMDLTARISISQPAFPFSGSEHFDLYRSHMAADSGGLVELSVKVLRAASAPATPKDKVQVANRLCREAREWSRRHHPNIQPILGLWWNEGLVFPGVVSRWQENGNILQYLERYEPTAAAESDLYTIKLDLIKDILRGIVYLHSESVVHGNIKGSNVLVSAEGQALLCDVGLFWTADNMSNSHSQTIMSTVSLRHLAPEIISSDDAWTLRTVQSDMWAFGCLVFEVLSGSPPWVSDNTRRILVSLSRQRLFPRAPWLDDQQWYFVQRCCDFDPSKRPSASEAMAELPRLMEIRSDQLMESRSGQRLNSSSSLPSPISKKRRPEPVTARKLSELEDEHHFEAASGSGASLTFPMQCSALRKGGHVVIKGRPCKIVDMSTSKTGKHGHAKIHIIAIDIFTGKKLEDISPSTHNMDVPTVNRTEYTLVNIDDGYLNLITSDGISKDDVKVPDGDIGKQIETEFNEGKELLITVVAAMGEEQAIAIRATSG